MPRKTRRNNNNNLIFPMNKENPRKVNKKQNNTKKVNRKPTMVYMNKYVNKPKGQPYVFNVPPKVLNAMMNKHVF